MLLMNGQQSDFRRRALASTATAGSRRKIFVQTDANFLQFFVRIAGGTKRCLWKAGIGGCDLAFHDGGRHGLLAGRCQLVRDINGIPSLLYGREVIVDTQTAAAAVGRPLLLPDSFGGEMVKHFLNGAVGDRARRAAILRTTSGFSLRPQAVHHESDLPAIAALARIFVTRRLGAKIRSRER